MISEEAHSLQDDVVAIDADLGILHSKKLSCVLTGEMSRLYAAGFSLMPLGGDTGRRPLLSFKKSDGAPIGRHSLARVIGRMAGGGSENYAIRLKGMLVIDIDTDTPEAQEYVMRRFGESAVQVKTSRGVHHYFRFAGKAPAAIRYPGIAIDFKAGEQALAGGPYAVRSDGATYLPLRGQLQSVESLPPFCDRDCDREQQPPERARVKPKAARGDRHTSLKQRGLQLARVVESEAELFSDLIAFREWECEFPEEIPDEEVRGLAAWFWFKRCNNELWGGRQSPMGMTRASLDMLLNIQHGQDAWLLYSYVHGNHEHLGREFAIVAEGIHAAGQLKALSRKDIRRAATLLVQQGLLVRREVREGMKRKYLYRIAGGRQGGGTEYYINAQYGHTGLTVLDGGKADVSA